MNRFGIKLLFLLIAIHVSVYGMQESIAPSATAKKQHAQELQNSEVIRLRALINDPHTTLQDRAIAQVNLGELYYFGGFGVQKDVKNAQKYLMQAATQDANQFAKAIAQENLAEIDKEEKEARAAAPQQAPQRSASPAQRTTQPLQHKQEQNQECQRVIRLTAIVNSPSTTPQDRAIVQAMLGDIYYFGGFGVEKDYARAQAYYKQAIDNPHMSPEHRAIVQVYLGKIYYDGGFGVQRDVKEARKYLMQAAAQDANIEVKVNAQKSLAVIDKEEKEAQAVAPQQLPQQQARVAIKRSPVEERPGKSKRMRKEEEDKERENE